MNINKLTVLILLCFNTISIEALDSMDYIVQDDDKCFLLSQDFSDGKLKGYGSATSINEMAARSKAMMFAQGELARQIETIIEFTQRYYMEICEEDAKTEFSDSLTQTIQTQVKEKIERSRLACSTRERLSDGKWRYTVCVVMEEEITSVLKSIPEIEVDNKMWDNAVDAAIEEYLKTNDK